MEKSMDTHAFPEEKHQKSMQKSMDTHAFPELKSMDTHAFPEKRKSRKSMQKAWTPMPFPKIDYIFSLGNMQFMVIMQQK